VFHRSPQSFRRRAGGPYAADGHRIAVGWLGRPVLSGQDAPGIHGIKPPARHQAAGLRRITVTDRQPLTAPEAGATSRSSAAHGPRSPDGVRLALVVGALGVVFGDIGTSPIYTLQTVFNRCE
jgi:hypothetical protein